MGDAFSNLRYYDFDDLKNYDEKEIEQYRDFYLRIIKLYRKRFKNVLEQYNCYMFNKNTKNGRNFQQYNF